MNATTTNAITTEVAGQSGTGSPKVTLHCSCEVMWSLAQQFTMKQIVQMAPVDHGVPDLPNQCAKPEKGDEFRQTGKPENTFVHTPYVRARRIAAAFARMYLEDFDELKGVRQESRIGRFYWMGLSAFASKQVAVTLENWRVKLQHATFPSNALYKGLSLDNLWLYNHVMPWFFVYAIDDDTFRLCAHQRDSRKLEPPVLANLKNQEYYTDELIQKIPHAMVNPDDDTGKRIPKGKGAGAPGYLQWTPLLGKVFDMVAEWEKAKLKYRPSWAWRHLRLMIEHEQGEVLQGLIYDDPGFAGWLDLRRDAIKTRIKMDKIYPCVSAIPKIGDTVSTASLLIQLLTLNLQLVLTSGDTTDDPEFRSDAPELIVLQNYTERINWQRGGKDERESDKTSLKSAAGKYHKAMKNHPDQMIQYLRDMAKWYDKPDVEKRYSWRDVL